MSEALQVRNTLVLVEIEDLKNTMIGQLLVPVEKKEYCVGRVISIGPGNVISTGGRSETDDLKVGDRVLVRSQIKVQGRVPGAVNYRSTGIELSKEGKLVQALFEQTEIVAIYVDDLEVPTLITD